ncbi:MAG: PEP-CTERM sorting domain-containing protein [Planctomycetes bacterium]|jgi:hypothetical protein|nr:PEP-CTERM sorting domain-containing protein [Planctomycetota bacterium]
MKPALKTKHLLIAAVALSMCFTGIANAQQDEQVINVSGATLFSDFFSKTASVNDWIHVDGDDYQTYGVFQKDTLAPSTTSGAAFRSQAAGQDEPWWLYQYRGHGSGNGLAELVNYWDGGNPAYPSSGSYLDLTPGDAGDGEAWCNMTSMGGTYAAPATTGPAVQWFGSNSTHGSDPMTYSSTDKKVRVDMGVMDVPTTWFVTVSGQGAYDKAPRTSGGETSGYGNNGLQSIPQYVNADYGYLEKKGGTPGTADTVGNVLKSLVPEQGPTLNTNTGSPDNHTVYDTPLVAVNIGYVSNPGAAVDSTPGDGSPDCNIKKSDLQHLYATGRMPNGENLVAISRDSGSGTRNAAMNSIGLDPSWGRGENYGPKEKHDKSDVVGPFYAPSNINSSSHMRDRITESRLAVGYNAFYKKAGPPSLNGQQEILSVMNDLGGGTQYVTPKMETPEDHPTFSGYNNGDIEWDATSGKYYVDDDGTSGFSAGDTQEFGYNINNIAHNAGINTGWQVGGYETVATVGNPFSEDIDYDGKDLDGDGLTYADGDNDELGKTWVDDDGTLGFSAGDSIIDAPWEEGDGGPAMQNQGARDYIRNIVGSIQSYEYNTGSTDTYGTPAQYMAEKYTLIAQLAAGIDDENPGGAWVTNPDVNDNLHEAGIVPTVAMDTATGDRGTVPNRLQQSELPTGYAYTDTTSQDKYVTLDGTTMKYGVSMSTSTLGDLNEDSTVDATDTALSNRNWIAGDFDGDFNRDTDDINEMVVAYKIRHNVDGYSAADVGDLGTNGGKVCPELMGDFNSDGRFDDDDVRYGVDGLFTNSPLDRKQNYIDLDTADSNTSGSGNFFGTVLANGTYNAGDSRADIAGLDLDADGDVDGWDNPRGWGPIGADGTVDAKDIDYVYAQFKNNPYLESVTGNKAFGDGVADWDVIEDAIYFDLSADIDGDLDVDQDDVDELVGTILETTFGDTNLDGDVDLADLGTCGDNLGTNTGAVWSIGDANGDGDVDLADLGTVGDNLGYPSAGGSSMTVTPEPATMTLLGLGGLAMLARRRRRRRA